MINLPDSKTGAKPIYLSDAALGVLRNLHDRPDRLTSDYIIKGRHRGKPLVNLTKPWHRLCAAADLQRVRLHDLRHTAASIGVGSGVTLPIVGRLLGHSQPQTTQRYAHVDADPALAWISTDWNPSNAGFGKGFRQLRISALSVIRYGELITRVHAVSFASATILGESGAPRFRCIDLRRMPASWRSQVSWFNSRLTPDMANDTAHMCLSDHYMN